MIKNKNDIEKIIYDGKLIKILNFDSKNFNSEACLYKWLGDKYVIRKVGKQYNLSNNNLAILEKDIRIYYKLLKKYLPIKLPNIFFTKIDRQQNTIFLVTEYFPKGKVVDIKNNSQKIEYFKTICKLILKLASSRNNLFLDKLICTIDPNPDNFFIDFKNQLIYNDFSPPLYRKKGKWFEFRRLDEMHSKKSDKEKRYFTGFSLLLAFINKTRLYLSFPDYLKIIKWVCREIQNSNLPYKNNIIEFPEFFTKLYSNEDFDFKKIKKYSVLRDLLRFRLSFCKDLTGDQIKKIYKESKKIGGISYLEKKLKNIIN